MQYRRLVSLLLIVVFTSSHAGEDASGLPPHTGIEQLRFTAQFRTSFGRDFDPGQVPKTLVLYRLDPGYLLDMNRYSGTSRVVQDFTLSRDELVMDVADWSRVARTYATTAAGSLIRGGLSIVPAQSRIASIHALTYLPGDGYIAGRHLGKRSELQTEDRQPAPLVYFDRPCRVSGTIRDKAGNTLQVDIEVPGAGFHLLRYAQQPDRGYSLVIAPQAAALVFVTLF